MTNERIPQKRVRPEDLTKIRVAQFADRLFARVYHHVEVRSPCPVPREGPAILVCNHTSSLDPALIQACCSQRLITWMMAAEYMELKSLAWFFRMIGIIPVERSGRDSGPLRAALRKLEDGGVLGVFPEGRISKTREFLPFQTGVAMMAIKTGVPVIPCFLEGTQRGKGMMEACLYRNECSLTFGEPIVFKKGKASKDEIDAATATLRAAIEALRERETERRRKMLLGLA